MPTEVRRRGHAESWFTDRRGRGHGAHSIVILNLNSRVYGAAVAELIDAYSVQPAQLEKSPQVSASGRT
jgi:hypothetical protein